MKRKILSLYKRVFKQKKPTRASFIQGLLTSKINSLYNKVYSANQLPSKAEIEEIENLEKLSTFVKDKKKGIELVVFPSLLISIACGVWYLVYTPTKPVDIILNISVSSIELIVAMDRDESKVDSFGISYNASEVNPLFLKSFIITHPGEGKIEWLKLPDNGKFDFLSEQISLDSSNNYVSFQYANGKNFPFDTASFTLNTFAFPDTIRMFISNQAITNQKRTNSITVRGGTRTKNILNYDNAFNFTDIERELEIDFFLHIDSTQVYPINATFMRLVLFDQDSTLQAEWEAEAYENKLSPFLKNFVLLKTDLIYSLTDGNVKFITVDDKNYTFEKGEYLQACGLQGMITNLWLLDDKITLEFSGTVKELKGGRKNLQKDLMPFQLDYILANRGNKLIYEITIAIIGLLYSAYLFFKSHR